MRKRAYVHVPALRGCSLMRDTVDDTIAAAPDAIRVFLRWLERHGEPVNPSAPFKTRLAEERLSSGFLSSDFYEPDARPLTKAESDRALARLGWVHDDLRRVTEHLTPAKLNAKPAKARPIMAILAHLCSEGGYLRGVSGSSRIQRLVDQGRIDPRDALDELLVLETERLQAMGNAERREVRPAGQGQWSANGAARRMVEHGWEHYLEICTRLGVEP
jgi:hypothetical protein